MNGEFRWMPQRAMYVLTVSNMGTDHHFEADPKFIHTDEMWMQLLKEVADFVSERGADVTRVKTKMKDYADIYLSTPYDEQEQDSEAGRVDEGRLGDTGGAGTAGEFVSAGSPPNGGEPDSASSPAPVAWDNFPEANGRGSSAADGGPAGERGSSAGGEPN